MREGLPELEPFLSEAAGFGAPLRSNTARKGDKDFKSPLPTPGHGLPKAKKPKTSRTGKKTEHAKSGPGGGRFISGGGGAEEASVGRALGVKMSAQDRSGVQASIKAFQKKHGLQVDGVVGRQTALALSGRYTEARSTAVGKMGHRERVLLNARHQPKARQGRVRARRRAAGGQVVEDDPERHGASQELILWLREEPAGFWDPTQHPKDFAGKWAKKLLPGKKGKHAALIPEYDPTPLKFGKSAGGTTGARTAKHRDGSTWLVKTYGGNEDRVATELLSNAVYRHMGAKAARAGRIKLLNGKQALSYPFLDGKPRKRVFQAKGKDRRNARLGEHFMTDALLGNWDVAGLDDDNVLWDPQGEPFRVDQGGTLEFRAQGSKKFFGPVPTEVSSMLLPGKGQAARSMLVTEAGLRLQGSQIEQLLTPGTVDALVDNAGFRDKAMRERVRKHLKERVKWMGRFGRGEVGFPELQESLQEMAKGIDFNWDQHDHPRDQHGKFVKTVFGLGTASSGALVNLDAKTYVKRDKDNTFRVVRSGQIIKGFQSAEDAARAALDRSVKGDDAGSVGGTTKHKDFNAYLKARGMQNVDTHTPGTAQTIIFGGKGLGPEDAQTELAALNARLAAAEALAKDDKYVARAVPTIKARQAELITKMQAAGIKPPPGQGGLHGQVSQPEPTAAHSVDAKVLGGIRIKVGQEFHSPKTSSDLTYTISKVDPDGTISVKWLGMASSDAKYTQSQFAKAAEMGWKPGPNPNAKSPAAEKTVMSGLDADGLPKVGSVFTSSGGNAKFKSLGVKPLAGVPKFQAEVITHSSMKPGETANWSPGQAQKFAQDVWKDTFGNKLALAHGGPDVSAGTPAAKQAEAKAKHGLVIDSHFTNSAGSIFKVTGSTPTQIHFQKIAGENGVEQGTADHENVAKALTAGIWKKGSTHPSAPESSSGFAGSAPKPASKKFPKGAKQANQLGPDQVPAKLKDLDLVPGDKVQHKSGGYVYTYQGPTQFGNGHVFLHEPTGKKKQWAGYSAPIHVIKADGSELKLKDPNVVPPVGTAQTPGVVTPATPKGPTMSLAGLKGTLASPPAGVTIGQLGDGDVIMTPDGKVGVIKPTEPAYTGYSSAYDVSTGQKFEAPSTKPPVKYSTQPSVKKEAAEHLEKAQAGTSVSVAGGAGGTKAKAPPTASVGPPQQFQGVASWENAVAHIPSAGAAGTGLTQDEKSAITSYTGSGYVEINAALRDSKNVKSLGTAKKAAAIKKALAKAVVKKDVWIGRRTENDIWKQEAQAGKVIADNGVISTSFTKGTWSGSIELNVLIREGSNALNVKSISSHSGENEVLLPPGSLFHVLKREEKGGNTVLYVEML